MKRGKKKAADCDTWQQSNENGRYPSPYGRNAVPIDEEDIQVNEDFDDNQCGVQDAITIENQCNWNGERGKPVAKGAIYEGRKQGDPCKNDYSSIKGKHLQFSEYRRAVT